LQGEERFSCTGGTSFLLVKAGCMNMSSMVFQDSELRASELLIGKMRQVIALGVL
jgi:hypothetical protein